MNFSHRMAFFFMFICLFIIYLLQFNGYSENTCKLHNGHSENQVIRIVCKRDKQSLIYSDWWVLTNFNFAANYSTLRW